MIQFHFLPNFDKTMNYVGMLVCCFFFKNGVFTYNKHVLYIKIVHTLLEYTSIHDIVTQQKQTS